MSHGDYNPPEVWCDRVTPNHHIVYLRRVPPGSTRRRRILIGEVRRHVCDGSKARGTRYWRAFPAAGPPEFPELFDNRYLALVYLKQRYESSAVVAEPPARVRISDVLSFFGEDPWAGA